MLVEVSNYRLLERFSTSQGAGLFGVADISKAKEDFQLSEETKRGLNRAVCLGVSLSPLILSEIKREPTKLYYHHYRTVNLYLDKIALAVTYWIQRRGGSAMPIPASQITDWKTQKAHLSHKKIGYLAGLGWIGKNNLLVSRKFGAHFRMATILTDMRLKPDMPLEGGCGACFQCIDVCPVGAIKERAEDFAHMACFEKLKSFQRQNIVGQFICGICVKACKPRG